MEINFQNFFQFSGNLLTSLLAASVVTKAVHPEAEAPEFEAEAEAVAFETEAKTEAVVTKTEVARQ